MRALTGEGKMQDCRPESGATEKTVAIASALGLFCLVIAVGALSLWAAGSFGVDLPRLVLGAN